MEYFQFYITLGVAVGGYSEFPDNSKSKDYEKPWNNFKSKVKCSLI